MWELKWELNYNPTYNLSKIKYFTVNTYRTCTLKITQC